MATKSAPAALSWQGALRALIGDPGDLALLRPQVPGRSSGIYRPGAVADVGCANDVWFAAASVKGPWHHEFNKPRQDSYAFALSADGRYVVAAVADGVSQAPLSHLAADLACQRATASVAAVLDGGTWVAEIEWAAVVRDVREAIRARAVKALPAESDATQEQVDHAIATQVMSTTLDVVVVDTVARPISYVVAGLSGDSSVYRLEGGRSVTRLRAGKAPAELPTARNTDDLDVLAAATGTLSTSIHSDSDKGSEVVTSVRALPTEPGDARLVSGTLSPHDALLVCTDGIGDPLVDGSNDLGHFLARTLSRSTHVSEVLRAMDFVQLGAIDDRTGVVVWAPSS